jgi:hypothetical protein
LPATLLQRQLYSTNNLLPKSDYVITKPQTVKTLYEAVDLHLRNSEYTAGKNSYESNRGIAIHFDGEPESQSNSSEFLVYINGLYLISSDNKDVAQCAENQFFKQKALNITRGPTHTKKTNSWIIVAAHNQGEKLRSHVETKSLLDLVYGCYEKDIEDILYIDIHPKEVS